MTVTLTPIKPGCWQLHGAYDFTVFAVRIRRWPSIWELQDAGGRTIFGDAFESLYNVHAYFNQESV